MASVQDVLQDPPNQLYKEQHVYINLQDQLYLFLCEYMHNLMYVQV